MVWVFTGATGLGTVTASSNGANQTVFNFNVSTTGSYVIQGMSDWAANSDTTYSATNSGTLHIIGFHSGNYGGNCCSWSNQSSGTRGYGVQNLSGTVDMVAITAEIK